MRSPATFAGLGTFLLSTLVPLLTNAQITSTLSGRVLDPQGLALLGASVQIKSEKIGLGRSTQTDSTGSYWVTGLTAATYTITVSKNGFSAKSLTGIELTVNANLNLNIALELAKVHSTVAVNASAALLDKETSSSGTVIAPVQIDDMPLNGRNYLDLLQLSRRRSQPPSRSGLGYRDTHSWREKR